MKIVLFDYVFEPRRPGISGLSDLVWNWAKHLVLIGEQVHIVAPYPEGIRPPRGVTLHRFATPPIGYRNVIGHVLIAVRGWLEIRKLQGASLVHAPEYLSTGVFVLLARQLPVVLTVPGNVYERVAHGNPFDWSMTLVLKAAARLSATRCARVIATSEDMKMWWLRTGALRERVVVIPCGVDTHEFGPVPGARKWLGIPEGRRVVLYVGRLSQEKGIGYLFEAIARLGRDFRDLELHLLGEGPQQAHLMALSRRLNIANQVHFHGWVDRPDLPYYYSAADVTVLPSLSEPFGRVAIEAMACRCPFVGTKVAGIADIVHDKQTGFLVEAGDAEALATALAQVILHPQEARDVALRGFEYVRERLDWGTIVRRVRDEVYAKVVA